MVTESSPPARSKTFPMILANPVFVAAFGLFWLLIATLRDVRVTDEGIWGYQGWLWVRYHLPPYVASVENKPPGIFLLFALSERLFGYQYWFPRAAGVLCLLIASFALYSIGKIWRDRWTGLVAMSVFLLASAWGSFYGLCVSQTETFMTTFTTLAFYCVATAPVDKEPGLKRLFLAGFLAGTAMAFKQVAVLSAVGLGIFVLFLRSWYDDSGCIPWWPLPALGAGIILATLVSLIPLWASGVSMRDYIKGAWLILLSHGSVGMFPGSSASWATRLRNLHYILKRPDIIVFGLCLITLWRRRKNLRQRNVPVMGLLAWMICDGLAVNASGYYFFHQFKQLLPSLSLALGLTMGEWTDICGFKNQRLEEWCRLGMTWLLIAAMVGSRQMPGWRRTVWRMRHRAPSPEQVLGEWIHAHSGENDYVYTLGEDSPLVLNSSHRRSSSRYFSQYFIDANTLPEIMADLKTGHPPRYIVLENNRAPGWLWSTMGAFFQHRLQIGKFSVYVRSEEKTPY